MITYVRPPDTATKLTALADPRRREIFELLTSGPKSVAALSKELPVTRPAVSQHLKVLQDAGLVSHRVAGTRHLYRPNVMGVAVLRDYLDAMWRKALDTYKGEVDRAFAEQKEKQ